MLARRYQAGGSFDAMSCVYESPKQLQDKLSGIPLRNKKTGTTRCFGTVLDAADKSGYYMRGVLERLPKGLPRVIGDNDNVVDSWNFLDAAYLSDELEVIYDADRDGPLDKEMLTKLPLFAVLGAGDARGKYVSKENPKKLSRHTIGNMGYTNDGKPLIYDLGKISVGVPDKYINDINFIVVPKVTLGDYKQQEVSAPDISQKTIKVGTTTPQTIDKSNDEEIELLEPMFSTQGRDYMALLARVFGPKQRK